MFMIFITCDSKLTFLSLYCYIVLTTINKALLKLYSNSIFIINISLYSNDSYVS